MASQEENLGIRAWKESKGLARSTQKGRREVPCTLTLEATKPVLDGEKRETQITEVASQKGTLIKMLM